MPIHSMTGYGEQSVQTDHWEITVRLKTLNHRHLDTRISGLDRQPLLHLKVRNVIQKAFERGRVDLEVELKRARQAPALQFDAALAGKYLNQLNQIAQQLELPQAPSLEFLLGMDGVTEKVTIEEDTLWAPLAQGLELAIAQARQMRAVEGEHLGAELAQYAEALQALKDDVQARMPELKALFRQRLVERIAAWQLEVKLDDARLEEEVVLQVERCDISEELSRLDSHLAAVRAALGGGEPAGKKLDFIAQEMGREVNTIGAKVKDAEVSHLVIEMKSVLEKFREQGRNVE